MPNKYQTDFKRRIINRYEKGESIKKLSQELHIAQSTILGSFEKNLFKIKIRKSLRRKALRK